MYQANRGAYNQSSAKQSGNQANLSRNQENVSASYLSSATAKRQRTDEEDYDV